MNLERYYSEINKRFGNITRARGPFLYTQKNVRLTDLYQEGGRAILGWDSSAKTVFKNLLSKNLCGSFETAHRAQLQKAVSELLQSKRKIFFFSKKSDVMKRAISLNPESVSFYRPFGGYDYASVQNVVVEPPLPWTNNFFVLASSRLDLEIPSEFFPPALLAASARALYDLIAAQKQRQEKDFFIYDKILTKFFTRRACWLCPKVPEEKYDDFVLACLDAGVVISPDYNVDSIVPFGAEVGVLKKMGEINAEF